MKLYVDESVRFVNPHPIITLIGMLFLVLDARGEVQVIKWNSSFLCINKNPWSSNLIYHSIQF